MNFNNNNNNNKNSNEFMEFLSLSSFWESNMKQMKRKRVKEKSKGKELMSIIILFTELDVF